MRGVAAIHAGMDPDRQGNVLKDHLRKTSFRLRDVWRLEVEKKIVFEEVKKDSNALHWKVFELDAEYLRNDREVVREAMRQNPEAFQYASKKLKSNR